MIQFIFTIDYEIYGNGEGSLKELIYDPAAKLIDIFLKHNTRFVPFIEVAELELIEANTADPLIDSVKKQIRYFHNNGFELGLHLHPQWYNARHDHGTWQLDYSEYNLCTQSPVRINQIVERSINYFRHILGKDEFTPLSFRAGNWLFHPTGNISKALTAHSIKIDSSVFKGGLQHQHHLDYRPAIKNGYFWKFQDDVNKPTHNGEMIEIPIYTEMVPPWQMATKKRLGLQQKTSTNSKTMQEKIYRLLDIARPFQPLKLDFCRMTREELTSMTDQIIKDDQQDPQSFKPIVAIGHTKDLVDFATVDSFLRYLEQQNIKISTFADVYNKINN
jgi:hypothetical protein